MKYRGEAQYALMDQPSKMPLETIEPISEKLEKSRDFSLFHRQAACLERRINTKKIITVSAFLDTISQELTLLWRKNSIQ